jgi:16S rRNA (guanine(966)-N(2))-methyltransferase RsmD
MRVIAGEYRSRPLQSLPGMDVRPTSDRLRETLFNVLASGDPEALRGTVWLDLYAGTGAVGIEAISRGAGKVYFVESSLKTVALIEKNLSSLGIAKGFEVLRGEVESALRRLSTQEFKADVIFLDPPYRMREAYASTLEALGKSPLVGGSTRVVAEHEKKFDPGEEFGKLVRYRKLVQGDAGLSFYGVTV